MKIAVVVCVAAELLIILVDTKSYELNDLCSGARICIQVSRGNGCMIYVYTISPDRISSVHRVLGEGIEFC